MMMIQIAIEPLTWLGIGSSVLAGAIIGIERQIAGKPVGMRTSALICLGTYVFTRLGTELVGTTGDPTRVLGQIVTGVGFLGAGVMMTKDKTVFGVTSAASIWLLAGIGAAVGLGHTQTAITLALVVVVILSGISVLEHSFRKLRRGVHRRGD